MTERTTAVVHVITELGPTDDPGFVVPAQLLGPRINGQGIFYYDPFVDDPPRHHATHGCDAQPRFTDRGVDL